MYTRGAVPETRAALSSALATAEALGDADYQLRALWGLCVDRLNNAVFREALAFAERFRDVADRDGNATDRPIGDRMLGLSLHFLGEEERSQRHFERMLETYMEPARRSHLIRFQFDQRVTAQVAFAEVLWIRGYPDRALRTIVANIEEAQGLGHALSLCNALAKACPVALLAGDLATAGRMVSMLLEHSARNALASWLAEGQCFQGVLLIRTGNRADGVQMLDEALASLPGINFSLRYTGLLGELAEALGEQGDISRGLSTVDAALARAELQEERWCVPELLRIKGDLLLRGGSADELHAAEACLKDSLTWARRQQALSWELRAATSLARLRQGGQQLDEGRDLLAATYGRFTEGFDTADLVAAKALLETPG
jgi:predicted ATPase